MMSGVGIAASVAAILSGLALISCLLLVPSLLSEIQGLRDELDTEMMEFRVK